MAQPWVASLADALLVSVAAMRRYPLRTALSVLGIVIGVAAVMGMLSVSEGGRRAILRQVDRLGLQTLVAQDQIPSGQRGGGLRLSDVEGVRRLVPSVVRTAGVNERWMRVSGPRGAAETLVMGVTADYAQLRRLGTSRGRLLTSLDRGETRVCVVGAGIGETLFGAEDPIGREVAIEGRWFTVVGVLGRVPNDDASGELPFPSSDHQTAALVPLAALDGHAEWVPQQHITQLWIEAADGVDPRAVEPIAERALEALHHDRRDFLMRAPMELLSHRLETQRVFNIIAGSIACLALLVGGVGIMNIMLASVVERTPEIGVRRTVGATRQSIVRQFVIESVAMTAMGGVFGVGAGAAAAAGVTRYAGWPIYVGPSAVLLALVAAVAVGLTFGIYPALRAARLPPIEAVRYE